MTWLGSVFMVSRLPTSLPRRITKIRSVTPNNSGNSEEMNKMAFAGFGEVVEEWNKFLRFAPTSMPRVGSSKIMKREPAMSQRAMSSFC